MTTFSELGIGKDLCEAAARMGWAEPTPVQAAAIPVGITGKDVLAQAQTGTGKTGAFAFTVLARTRPGSGIPTVLVLSPTRELADQVAREMYALSKETRHRVTAIYGGAPYSDQMRRLSAGCDIVVGTPGRVIDMCEREVLDLSEITELVIDEADRMLDMGFTEDVRTIVDMLPSERQTLMFSATFSDEVRDLANGLMNGPEEVTISPECPASDLVEQSYVIVERSHKYEVLRSIISKNEPKTLVFCATKKMVDDLTSRMSEDGLRVGSIHGDMPQSRREKTIRAYRNDRMAILVATDVAARGLDIDNIECVVNYDTPTDPETYTHRIGRAGRAGKKGSAISLVTPREDRRVTMYEDYTGVRINRLSPKKVMAMDFSSPEVKAYHEEKVRLIQEARDAREAERAARGKKKDQKPRHLETAFEQISLNAGKSDGVSRNDILEFLTVKVGIPKESVGRIGLGKRSSFVEISSEYVEKALKDSERRRLGPVGVHAIRAPEKVRMKDRS